MHCKSLADVRELSPHTVTGISDDSAVLRRLSDMGFTEGAGVMRLFSSPSGSISAYLIRDTVIALRRGDAEKIYVSEDDNE